MSGPWEKYAQEEGPWAKYTAPAYTPMQKNARMVGQFSQGTNDAIANTVGAPVDAAAWLLRKAGLPVGDRPAGGSESLKSGIDYVATLPGRVGSAIDQRSLAPFTDDRTSRFEPADRAEKIARLTGEGVGNALSIVAPAGVVANTARAGSVTERVANVLASQPVVQTIAGAVQGGVTGATDDPWMGLAAGTVVPLGASVVRRAVSPVTNVLTPQEQRLAQAAEREGIRLTPGQSTGSPLLRSVEGTMNSLPGASGPMKNTLRNQREQFNSAVLSRAGITANEASPEVLDHAFKRAGQTFDDLASRTTLNVDPQFGADIRAVADRYGRRLPTDVAPVFRSYMDDIEPLLQAVAPGAKGATLPAIPSTLNPQIAGDIYGRVRSDIGATIRSNHDNPDLQKALRGIQTALDDVVERSSAGPLREEWQTARREYQALMTVDKAMQGGRQAERTMADIPFSGLKEAVRQSDPRGFSRGRGQLNELARVGELMADKMPDSGTVNRAMLANPLHWPTLAGAAVGSRLYNSRIGNAYLTNDLAGTTNFNALYGGEAARQALEEGQQGRTAVSRRGGRR